MSINLWYDYVFGDEVINNLISKKNLMDFIRSKKITFDQLRNNAILPDFLKKNNIEFNLLPSVSAENVSNHDWASLQFLPIELNWIKDDPINFNFKNSQFLKYGLKNTKFLLWFPNEAIDLDATDLFCRIRSEYPYYRIQFVHGNLKTPYFVKDLDYVDYKPFDYFWWHEQQFKRLNLDINRTEKNTFSFYNNRIKLHRSIPYYRLMKEGLLDNSESTFNGVFTGHHQTGNKKDDLMTEWKYYKIRDSFISENIDDEYQSYFTDDEFIDWNLSNFSYDNNVHQLSEIRSNHLNMSSYLDIVSETYAVDSDNLFFITEKTYRPITRGCIFLILGNPGILRYLKSKGIETFDDLFDESYDETIHWFNRWKIIEKNIKTWIQLGEKGRLNYYKKSFDKLRHNQNVIYSRNFKEEIESLFQW